jgi:hypothetical protein
MEPVVTIEQSAYGAPVQLLNHNAAPVEAKGASTLQAVIGYLKDNAAFHRLNTAALNSLALQLEPAPLDEQTSFRLESQKDSMGITSFVFPQTYAGLPVWEAGVSVAVDRKRDRILSSQSSAYDHIELANPGAVAAGSEPLPPERLPELLGVGKGEARQRRKLELQSQRLLVYRYVAAKRTIAPVPDAPDGAGQAAKPLGEQEFVLSLPQVPESIKEGAFYVVREVIFTLPLHVGLGPITWRAFLEPETGAVLFLRAFASSASALVFAQDPITKGTGAVPSSGNAVLNPIRDSVTLERLSMPAGGVQSLRGSLVSVQDVEAPTGTPPTEGSPFNFIYNVRSNNFAATNAYFHCDRFFQMVLDMGFPMSYFGGTSFPVPVDHRGLGGTGNTINAHCLGNPSGITSVDFALADLSDVGNPLGIAADWRIVLHEIGGHGVLYPHVGGPNFGFAHSAGDSVAAILNDPGSLAPDRFLTFPWVTIGRRHDRAPGAGWGWAGNIALNPFDFTLDRSGYNNEQILSTTLFRLYGAMGGDSADLNRRRFAARFATYLILRAIGTLTATTNPSSAAGFELALENADAVDWVSANPAETHAGGSYLKVIRWAFEKQGLFQRPGTATPNNNLGDPPPVDVYIDDGRRGEYQFQPNHWTCLDIWNKRNPPSPGDPIGGGGVHEEPVVSQTNYAYVRIKNRGYQAATGIMVNGFHCLPGVGLTFPNDWTPMTTPQLAAPDLPANDTTGIVVGPFEWKPSQIGHECMFFSVSAAGDPSNIDARVTGPISEWRLVPHDNNIGQRNVAPVASTLEGLIASFRERPFWIRNGFEREVKVAIEVTLPDALERAGWRLRFVSEGGDAFYMRPGERKKVLMAMMPGKPIDPRAEAGGKAIGVTVRQDGIVVGGMTYVIDPKLERRAPQVDDGDSARAGGLDLLSGIDLGKLEVRHVRARRLSVDIVFDDGPERT